MAWPKGTKQGNYNYQDITGPELGFPDGAGVLVASGAEFITNKIDCFGFNFLSFHFDNVPVLGGAPFNVSILAFDSDGNALQGGVVLLSPFLVPVYPQAVLAFSSTGPGDAVFSHVTLKLNPQSASGELLIGHQSFGNISSVTSNANGPFTQVAFIFHNASGDDITFGSILARVLMRG